MTVTVSRKDINAIKLEIRNMSKRVQNPTPAWRKVGSYLAAANRKQFATHGAYYGKPWRPLKPDYLQWKIKNGYSRKTLVQTGAMRASFVSRPMAIEKYSNQRAVFGSNHRLAAYHHFGTHRNGKPAIPARPIMVKNRKVVQDIKQIVQDWVTGKSQPVRKYL